jgi:putative acetyltransferase
LAFPDEPIPRLVEAIRSSPGYVPELSLVAEIDGRIVGHVMLSYASLESGRVLLLLSPLGVRPEAQRHGIGRALVTEALRLAEARGEPLVIVEGIPDYYPRFGFEPHERFGIEPPGPHTPREAFMVRPLSAYDPSIRGRVIYPPAFEEVS